MGRGISTRSGRVVVVAIVVVVVTGMVTDSDSNCVEMKVFFGSNNWSWCRQVVVVVAMYCGGDSGWWWWWWWLRKI